MLVAWLLPPASTGQARSPQTVVRESTITATVDRIERSSRVVTFRSEGNIFQSLYIPPELTAFDRLRVGDVVTVRYTEAIVVAVRPGAKLKAPVDTTAEARRTDDTVTQQLTAVVTIDSIDSQGLFLTYRTGDNARTVHRVKDPSLVKGLKAGDRVEITVTRAQAISIVPRR